MQADNAQHLARWRSEQDAARNQQVLDVLRATAAGEASWSTVAQFCMIADVGRSWLYASAHWDAVRAAREEGRDRRRLTSVTQGSTSSAASLRARLATALDDNRRLRAENQRLSQDLANALGLVRDLRADPRGRSRVAVAEMPGVSSQPAPAEPDLAPRLEDRIGRDVLER